MDLSGSPAGTSYTLTVTATDRGTPPHSGTSDITVLVLSRPTTTTPAPVLPDLPNLPATANVLENQPIGTSVFNVAWTQVNVGSTPMFTANYPTPACSSKYKINSAGKTSYPNSSCTTVFRLWITPYIYKNWYMYVFILKINY